MKNNIVWVDLPVLNLDRAISFYSGLLANQVSKESYGDFEFAVLSHQENESGACLVPGEAEDIITRGPLIYFNVDGRIEQAVEFARNNHGTVIEEVNVMGEHGSRAIIKDSEGNRVALHSN